MTLVNLTLESSRLRVATNETCWRVKPVDFLITVLANEPVSIGFLTDEPLMNDMCGLGVTQTDRDHGCWIRQSPLGCWISYILPCWARIRHFQICWIQGACQNWHEILSVFLRCVTSFCGIKEECIKRGLGESLDVRICRLVKDGINQPKAFSINT